MKTNKSVPFHVRQGDVFIKRVDKVPSDAKPIKRINGRVILAYGEVTGHHHSLTEEHVSLHETASEVGVTYLEVKDAMAQLAHQEHSTIDIPPGVYRVTIQREYTPAGLVNVRD